MRLQLSQAVFLLCLTLTGAVACGGASRTAGPPPGLAVEPTSPPAPTESPAVPGMVLIPAGQFIMGASLPQRTAALEFGWPQELRPQMDGLIQSAGPPHQVVLGSYYIDQVEVTNQKYRIFLGATGHRLPQFWNDSTLNSDMQPVTGVSWFDARTYCGWAGKRLPTEAEWEKAARGTDGLAFPWGEVWDPTRLHSAESVAGRSLSNYDEWTLWLRGSLTGGSPAPVGSYPDGASPYGVLDMAGNVWEWVADWYDPAYYETAPETNPKGPATGTIKVVRGGAWDVPWAVAFTWFRERFVPPEWTRSVVVGFRCVSSEPPKESTDGRAGHSPGLGILN